ncbi:putative spermidine/putrescine transport system permease protein [Stella humosa]|uniref:Putative spermidine/putrescine transport system permease protein n=1 Tax=Stella humosa TaxID=94 RepID=A0A3N1LGI6_9PROT|nr:ABC transporter permease [Stella humosa]ROP90522.1 putative spermidine/putrescine transport system permease protein [Stella humosa]BBK29583.1 ABC transporter permease [Stella humosa]
MSVVIEEAAGGRRRSIAPALVGPATILVILVLVIPMAILFRYSLNQFVPGKFMVEAVTVENYVKFFTDAYYLKVLWTTIQVAVACTIISLTLAFPVAYFLARTTSRFKSLLVILAVFPLMVGNVVRAAGWMVVLGNEGVVNALLRWAGVIAEPIKLLYTPTAVVIGIIAVVLPYMILTLQSVLEGIDYSVEEAALNLGAKPSTTFFRIVLPLAMPGVLAGTVLVFILCMNAYATPVLLGGPQFKMMAPALYDQIARSTNWPFGAALAFVLMTTTLTLTILSTIFLQRRIRR